MFSCDICNVMQFVMVLLMSLESLQEACKTLKYISRRSSHDSRQLLSLEYTLPFQQAYAYTTTWVVNKRLLQVRRHDTGDLYFGPDNKNQTQNHKEIQCPVTDIPVTVLARPLFVLWMSYLAQALHIFWILNIMSTGDDWQQCFMFQWQQVCSSP